MTKKKILVAEDDEDVLFLFKSVLSKDYELILAPDGKEAFDLFQEHSPDLVITDIYMPTKDGLDLIKAIRAESDVAIIVESGGAINNLKNYFDFYKISAVLTKPFSALELKEVVEKAFS